MKKEHDLYSIKVLENTQKLRLKQTVYIAIFTREKFNAL